MEKKIYARVEVREANYMKRVLVKDLRYWINGRDEAVCLLLGVLFGFYYSGKKTRLEGFVYDESGKVIQHSTIN